MELRLLRFITTPAMVASWILGLILAFSGVIDWRADGWFHAKLALVILLSAFHGSSPNGPRTSRRIATRTMRVSTA